MYVKDLIAQLQEYDEYAEVKVAIQPNYPLAVELLGCAIDTDPDNEDAAAPVFLVTGSHSVGGPYASPTLWEVI